MDCQISFDQYQRIFAALPGAFLLMLPDADFTIADASEGYLQATLRERSEILGRPVFEVFPDNPETPDANSTLNLSRSLKRVAETGKTDVMAVQRYDVLRADGAGFEKRYWSPVNAPVFAPDGTLLCIVHRVDNVTEYVRMTEEHARQREVSAQLSAENIRMEAEVIERSLALDRLNDDLRRANEELSTYVQRVREDSERKDEFLAMLAHELRNPLAAMSSALQLWTMVPSDEARHKGLVEICKRQVRNLTRLVDDLLEMSRIDRGAVVLQKAPLDLRDAIDHAMHATRDLFERRRLTVATRMAPASFHALGDATRLEQSLTNLLTNAAKYSEPGGKVELSLEPVPMRPGWARIEVKDEGRGIAPDKLEAIFEIFYQADVSIDRSRGGLGIGLALVRAIVGLHGGSVRAHSEGIGHGSTFTIELPLLSPTEHEARPDESSLAPAATAPRPPGRSLRVLIVEDNGDARETLCELLAAFGYTVTTAANGIEGLDLLIKQPPDVAIIDIGLPGMDGFEVARRARGALGESTRLVAMTGYSSVTVQAAAKEAGFDMHVAKPCTSEKLVEILAPLAAGPH